MSTSTWVRSVRRNVPARRIPLWVWGLALGLAVLAGFAVAKPVIALALLGAVGLGALTRRIFLRPAEGFIYALCLFPFYTFLRGGALAYHVPLPMAVVGLWPEVLLCIMMAGILCQRIRTREKLRVGWDDAPMALLLFSTIYGVILSVIEKDPVGVVYGFHQSVTPYLFFFVARWLPAPPNYLNRVLKTWFVSFCIFAVLSFADYALRPNFVIAITIEMRKDLLGRFDPYDLFKWYPRMQSLLFGEQLWGTLCVLVVLYGLIALFQKHRPLQNRLGLWPTFLLAVAGLACSMSRGAFVCFAIAVFSLMCFRGPHRKAFTTTVIALIALCIPLAAVVGKDARVASLTMRTAALFSALSGGSGNAVRKDGSVDESNSATNRMNQWQRALELFPLFPAGRGLGRAGSAAVMHNTSVSFNDTVSDGGYFRILAEAGLPGIVCFFVGLAGVMHTILFGLLKKPFVRGEDRAIALTLFAFLSGLLVQNVGGNAFDSYYIVPFVWLLFGLLLTRRDRAAEEAAHSARQTELPPTTAIAPVGW